MPRVAQTPAQVAATTNPPARRVRLKTWPEYWDAVRHGTKTFEVRKNDRNFAVGDLLELQRWNPETGKEDPVEGDDTTCSILEARVSYVLPGGAFGVEPGFVVLGLGRRRAVWE